MDSINRRRILRFLSFFLLFVFLSYRFRVEFGRVGVTPNWDSSDFALPEVWIQERVLLPDAVLILLYKTRRKQSSGEIRNREMDCVYEKNSSLVPALSVDGYDEFRWIVRCPLPPANRSASVSLRWRRGGGILDGSEDPVSFPVWDRVAYEAVVDSGTAVVFVKGFNLRRDKKFDPNRMICKFESGITLTSIAVAQEVVRCPLPEKALKQKLEGVKVAVDWPESGQPVPSVARLYLENKNRGVDDLDKYGLCGCTMVWNQAHALREWVVYHARLGVQRWFIYDNNSEDELKREVETLDLNGFNVTRHPWPWIKSQEAGFSHCVLRSKRECEWVAFFDVDEFYYFPPSKGSEISSLRELVEEYSGFGEIRTQCRSFGPSGLRKHPLRGVMVGYTCRVRGNERHKSIVKPEAVEITLANVVHHFALRKGFLSKYVAESRVVINHYKYQAWEAFKGKFVRRVSTYVADWGDDMNSGSKDRAPGLGKEAVKPHDWDQWFCEIWDTGLRDFVVANFADRDSGLLPWERTYVTM